MRWIILALLSAWLLLRLVGASAPWLDYPYPRGGSEGLNLYESLLVKHGGDPYSAITPESFISGANPPLFYWLTAAILPATLPSFAEAGNSPSLLQPGRALSLLSAIVIALLFPLLIIFSGEYRQYRKQSRRAMLLAGLIGGALFLSLPQVLVESAYFAGDLPALMLTAAGLVAIAASQRPGSNRESSSKGPNLIGYALLALGALLFALAFFTKQTALAGPLAAAAYLLLRDWRLGLKWCGLLLAMLVAPLALLGLATGGWFLTKVFAYHTQLLGLGALLRSFFAFWEDSWPLVLAALVYLLYRGRELAGAIRARDGSHVHVRLLIPLFALAALVLFPIGTLHGSDSSHPLTLGLAVCLCVGALLARVLGKVDAAGIEGGESGALPTLARDVAFGLVVVYAVLTSAPSPSYVSSLRTLSVGEREQVRKIVLYVREQGGEKIFSDEPGLLALAGKETPFNDPFAMTYLAERGRWDESDYRRMLRTGQFNLLALSCDATARPSNCRTSRFTPGVLDAVRDGYKILFPDVFTTLAPK